MAKVARKKNPYIGGTINEFIDRQRAEAPEFSAEWDSIQLAKRIRELREARRMTQAQLATRARTTQSAIARLEGGQVVPKLDFLQKVASAMGLRLSVDFTRTGRAA